VVYVFASLPTSQILMLYFILLTKKESVHASVKGGMKYNTGRLLMVLHKPLIPQRDDYGYGEEPEHKMLPMP